MIVGLLWVIRILIVLLIVRIVLRWFAERQVVAARRSRTSGERVGGQLVRDPQCGTFVAKTRAVTARGQSFCSTTCRDRWLAAAGRTAGSPP